MYMYMYIHICIDLFIEKLVRLCAPLNNIQNIHNIQNKPKQHLYTNPTIEKQPLGFSNM